MIEIKIPELAESISEGTIAEWLKNEGDAVSQGEAVAELETDKVNVEVNAEQAGVLKEILKQPGDTVEVGEVIAIIDDSGEGTADTGEAKPDETTEEKSKEQPTEKASTQQEEQQDTSQKADTEEVAPAEDQSKVIASPAARKLARERGIDLTRVKTQDPMGRITQEDVEAHEERAAAPAEQKAGGGANAQRSKPSLAQEVEEDPTRPVVRERMSRRRQTIANRLVEVQQTSAMLTTFNEVDMTAILNLRSRRKESFLKEHDIKLGFMSFFSKAVVGALKAFPKLNAEIQGDDMLIKQYYDIGIAVSTDAGLVVPVVRGVDRLSFAGIEKEIASLAVKARDNKLQLSDLQGGTFTITNGGIFGSLLSTPILNAPQVGILGMHTIQKRPVAVEDDKIELRPMMYIALSYDHRIVDGSEAVSFLVKVKQLLEDPESLLLEG